MGANRVKVLLVAVTAVVFAATHAIAANGPGSLDNGFGDRGLTSVQISSTGSGANQVVVRPDGSIIAGGVTFSGSGEDTDSDVALIAFTADGKLDTGFGGAGSVSFPLGASFSWETPDDLALTADDKILVLSTTADENFNIASGVARLDLSGELDPTLAGDGTLVVNPEGFGPANTILPLPDGDFYLVGQHRTGKGIVVARFNADGSPDPAMAGDGVALVELEERASVGQAVLTPAGDVVALTDLGLVRIDATGVADPSFGRDRGASSLFHLEQGPNGDFYAAGEDAVVRFGADGKVDESFADGLFLFSGASAFNGAGLAVGPSGKVFVPGASKRGKKPVFTVAMLKPNGRLSRPFGNRGFAVVKRGAKALAATVQDDGKIVAVGRTPGRNIFIGEVGGRDTKVAIARLLTR